MGFNNGYDSGYCDAKTEFAAEKAALEKRIAELEAGSGDGGGGSGGSSQSNLPAMTPIVITIRRAFYSDGEDHFDWNFDYDADEYPDPQEEAEKSPPLEAIIQLRTSSYEYSGKYGLGTPVSMDFSSLVTFVNEDAAVVIPVDSIVADGVVGQTWVIAMDWANMQPLGFQNIVFKYGQTTLASLEAMAWRDVVFIQKTEAGATVFASTAN